jgi:hypothetical protein
VGKFLVVRILRSQDSETPENLELHGHNSKGLTPSYQPI